jgi:flavin reductase (DIM6/NTAB) family NADH-FMN oxidoreductase RutF
LERQVEIEGHNLHKFRKAGTKMKRIEIPVDKLNIHPQFIWNNWLLLTAGENTEGKFNPMTVSWGLMGIMWNKPVCQVVVRPTRYTYEFMEKYDTYTLCAFPKEYRQTMTLLGTKSGRDIDKMGESGLTPIASKNITAPGYEEAELILECRKLMVGNFTSQGFVDRELDKLYNNDYHRFYYGEIVSASGIESYLIK